MINKNYLLEHLVDYAFYKKALCGVKDRYDDIVFFDIYDINSEYDIPYHVEISMYMDEMDVYNWLCNFYNKNKKKSEYRVHIYK